MSSYAGLKLSRFKKNKHCNVDCFKSLEKLVSVKFDHIVVQMLKKAVCSIVTQN
jgi:hypothetical protein